MNEEFESELYETKEDPQPNVQGVWRVINEDEDTTYLIRTDQVNCGDSVHTDNHDPNSRGYGGSEFRYRTTDGGMYKVKGPWHSSDSKMHDATHGAFSSAELHFTRVVIKDEDDNELYREDKEVLGSFHRGERIAQQLAVIQNRPIKFDVTTDGGGHAGTAYPGRQQHPLSLRKEDGK